MEHILLRCFWWINYIAKFIFLLLAVMLVCKLVECIFNKKLYFLYIAAEIVAFIAGIRMGFRTFHNLDIAHSFITVLGIICISIAKNCFWGSVLSKKKNCEEKDGDSSDEKKCEDKESNE